MKKLVLFLLVLFPVAAEAALPEPVCDQCGVYCDSAACEGLGGGEKCWSTGDPLFSAPELCRPCSEIAKCEDYFRPGLSQKIATNLCLRDPCDRNCGLSADYRCLSCDDKRMNCDVFLPGSFAGGKCCTLVGDGFMKTSDKEDIDGHTYKITQTDDFFKAECQCGCGMTEKGDELLICASGLYPKSFTEIAGLNVKEDKIKASLACSRQCAKDCGGYASEAKNCENGCKTYCTGQYGGASEDECIKVCKSGCEYRKFIADFVGLVYTVAGIAGVIMIIVHSMKLVSSQDARARSEAKTSLVYVIVALIIIALASAVVQLLTSIPGAAKPEPCDLCAQVDCSGGYMNLGMCNTKCCDFNANQCVEKTST